jgi:predicted RNase H-like HicB family nuclease
MENDKRIKATILLIKHPGEIIWTASVPAISGCVAEGATPQEAADNIQAELKVVTDKFPETKEKLKNQAEYLLTEVEI